MSVINVSQCHYPESDGKPMGETDIHRDEIIRHIHLLRHYLEDQQVYVSGDLLVYYEQGNPRKFVVPDTFIVRGVSLEKRRVYKTWVEHKVPDLVIETTSRKTRRKDTTEKPLLYARLGIKEYFLFDCLEEYLDPPLQGYRLAGSEYELIVPDAGGSLVSEELGLRLRREECRLQFYRLDNGERLLTADERAEKANERAEQAAERAEREMHARQAAEAELAKIRKELKRRK